MALRLYNTRTRQVEQFVPLEPGRVRMYCCGPTVYDYVGIHNARTLVTFDVVRRYIAYRGYEITFVQNVTDIEDKIIRRATENGIDPIEWAKKYAQACFEDMERLGVRPPDIAPHATGTLCEIQDLIQRLLDVGAAYETESGVYYRVEAFSEYGKLSGRAADDLLAGARVEVDEDKRDPRDFALWKRAKDGEPWWDSPWGPGRPGWHIECSAMVIKHLGPTIDIHAGGSDLIFPHHENEIAQSEKATGRPFVRYWLHGGLMRTGGERMGKSLGNFVSVREALDRFPVEAIRLFLLSTHYRKPLEYTPDSIAAHIGPARRLNRCLDALQKAAGDVSPLDRSSPRAVSADAAEMLRLADETSSRFVETVDDDLNFPGGLGVLFEFVHEANRFLTKHPDPSEDVRRAIATTVEAVDRIVSEVLGLRAPARQAMTRWLDPLLDLALQLRQEARERKDWDVADRIRDRLAEIGVFVHDAQEGSTWELAPEAVPNEVAREAAEVLVSLREDARAARDWARSDALRAALAAAGIIVQDTRDGSTWEWAADTAEDA